MKDIEQCSKCFHFGKSCRTGQEECAIRHLASHIDGKCLDYVDLKEINRRP